jgi:hypothetical protein
MTGKWDNIALTGQAVLAQYFQYEAKREEAKKRKTVKWDASSIAEEADEPPKEEADEPDPLAFKSM